MIIPKYYFFGEPGHIGVAIMPDSYEVDLRVQVSCMVHGPMKPRFERDQYECVGFDGEGCSAVLTHEQVYYISSGEAIYLSFGSTIDGWQATHNKAAGTLDIEVMPRGYERPSS